MKTTITILAALAIASTSPAQTPTSYTGMQIKTDASPGSYGAASKFDVFPNTAVAYIYVGSHYTPFLSVSIYNGHGATSFRFETYAEAMAKYWELFWAYIFDPRKEPRPNW